MMRTVMVVCLLTLAAVASAQLSIDERLEMLWERATRQTDFALYDDAVASGKLATQIDPQSASAWALLAYTQWMSPAGLEPEANASAEYALALDPDSALAHYAHGLCIPYVTDPPDYGAAIAELQEAARLDPDLARAWSYLGMTLVDSGDAPGAIEPLRRAVEINPDYWEWHLNLGYGLDVDWQLEEAVAASRRAVELAYSPFSEELARNNVAWETCLLMPEDADLREQALASARRAVELLPNDWQNLDTLGGTELLFGTPEAAEVALRAAIANGNNSFPALAYALLLQGQDAEAREVLHGAADVLTPANAEIQHAYFGALAWETLGEPEIARRIARHMVNTWPDAPWTKQVAADLAE